MDYTDIVWDYMDMDTVWNYIDIIWVYWEKNNWKLDGKLPRLGMRVTAEISKRDALVYLFVVPLTDPVVYAIFIDPHRIHQ